MRENIAYYFIILYLSVMFKPLLPLVGDMAGHFFAKAYHETVVHAQQGANHAEKELVEATSQNNGTKHQQSNPGEVLAASHLTQKETTNPIFIYFRKVTYNKIIVANLPFVILPISAPPPKLA